MLKNNIQFIDGFIMDINHSLDWSVLGKKRDLSTQIIYVSIKQVINHYQ